MKRVVMLALGMMLGVVSTVYAADDTVAGGDKASNAATKAQPNGAAGATPAMPGNETAKEKVTENRAKMEANREHAEAHRDRGEAHRAERPEKPERPERPEHPEKMEHSEKGGH